MKRRDILLLFCVGMLVSPLNMAAEQLFFSVNEGASSNQDAIFRNQKYRGLVEQLGRATGRKIVFESSNVLKVLERNLQSQRYDLAFVRPSIMSAKAMRDQGYRLVAMAKGEIKVHFIVPADSALKDIRDIRGKSILLPDKRSVPTMVAQAVIRDQGLDAGKENIQLLAQQEAVLYSIDNHLADVGVLAAPKLIDAWKQKGGRTLYAKDKLPFWAMIASSKVSDATVAKVQKMLLDLEATSDGRQVLKSMEVKGFVPGRQQDFLDMLNWVEGKGVS